GTSHDYSSERTGASDPSGNKDVEGGTVCDRLEEHSRKGGALRGGTGERRLIGRSNTNRLTEPALPVSDRTNQGWGVEMTMTPAKLRKTCGKVGGVYAMARLFGKGVSLRRLRAPS